MSIVETTLRELERARAASPKAVVAFSGGKDSLVVTDLAKRVFEDVEGFYMYLVPGMRHTEEIVERGRKLFGIKVRLYPHWTIPLYAHEGLYCPARDKSTLPKWKLMDVYALAMQEAKARLIVTGMKRADGINRARLLARGFNKDYLCHPIVDWKLADVVGYLRSRNIPLPPSSGRVTSGVDLNVKDALWLHDNYPDDFELLARYFPYVPAVVARRKFYGLET